MRQLVPPKFGVALDFSNEPREARSCLEFMAAKITTKVTIRRITIRIRIRRTRIRIVMRIRIRTKLRKHEKHSTNEIQDKELWNPRLASADAEVKSSEVLRAFDGFLELGLRVLGF